MRTRWLEFLKRRGESELPAGGLAVRMIELDAQPECPAGAPDPTGVHIRRLEATQGGGLLTLSECGLMATRQAPGVQLSRLVAQLDDPAVIGLNGAFPSYCGEEETSTKLLEIVRRERYQIIEWDCETPAPVKPIYGRILLLRGRGIDAD